MCIRDGACVSSSMGALSLSVSVQRACGCACAWGFAGAACRHGLAGGGMALAVHVLAHALPPCTACAASMWSHARVMPHARQACRAPIHARVAPHAPDLGRLRVLGLQLAGRLCDLAQRCDLLVARSQRLLQLFILLLQRPQLRGEGRGRVWRRRSARLACLGRRGVCATRGRRRCVHAALRCDAPA